MASIPRPGGGIPSPPRTQGQTPVNPQAASSSSNLVVSPEAIMHNMYKIRKEQHSQGKIMRELVSQYKWLQGEVIKLVQKSTQCFTPPPEMRIPPEQTREQFFEGFHNPNENESQEEEEENDENVV